MGWLPMIKWNSSHDPLLVIHIHSWLTLSNRFNKLLQSFKQPKWVTVFEQDRGSNSGNNISSSNSTAVLREVCIYVNTSSWRNITSIVVGKGMSNTLYPIEVVALNAVCTNKWYGVKIFSINHDLDVKLPFIKQKFWIHQISHFRDRPVKFSNYPAAIKNDKFHLIFFILGQNQIGEHSLRLPVSCIVWSNLRFHCVKISDVMMSKVAHRISTCLKKH